MNLLLDTHVLLWALMDSSKLSPVAVYEIQNPQNTVYVSAVSFWEISMKHAIGKLDLSGVDPADLPEIVSDRMGMQLLDLRVDTASGFHQIPRLHGDPFDRMLIHEAIENRYTMVSADNSFKQYESYGLKRLW